MSARRLVPPLALSLLFCGFCGAISLPAYAEAGKWEKMDEDNGIVAYKKEIPGSNVIAFRGVAVINARTAWVASVILDEKRSTEWMKDVTENRIVRKISDSEYVTYTHFKTPIVLKDRDFATNVKIDVDPATLRVTIRLHAVTDAKAPETSYVRGAIESGTWVLTPMENGKTRVEAEIHADPKGSVPDWIVNMVQKGWPMDTLAALRRQVAKSDIKELPEITAAFAAAKQKAAEMAAPAVPPPPAPPPDVPPPPVPPPPVPPPAAPPAKP